MMSNLATSIGDLAELSSRQNEILDVAARMFAERGFTGTDVQHVADDIGIGKGTIYRNFGSKEDLFLAAVDREMHHLTDQLTEAAKRQPDLVSGIRAAFHSYLSYFDARPWAAELIIIERAVFKDRQLPTYTRYREAVREYWEGVVRKLVDDGRFRDVSPSQVFELFSDTLYGAMFTSHFEGTLGSYAEKAEVLLDVLLNGLFAERNEDAPA